VCRHACHACLQCKAGHEFELTIRLRREFLRRARAFLRVRRYLLGHAVDLSHRGCDLLYTFTLLRTGVGNLVHDTANLRDTCAE